MPRDRETTVPVLRRWCLAVMVAALAAFVAAVVLAGLNQDEGWYLYAARQVMRGRLPHADFFFTQGQVMPAFYALFGWFWSPWGVLGGRVFSAVLSFTALCLASGAVVRCCRREADVWVARLLLWAFLGLNAWYVAFTAVPKAYALCVLGIAAGCRLLAGARPREGLPWWGAALAGVVFGLLPGVRLSMGLLLPVTGLWLLWRRDWAGRWAWLWFGLGGALGLVAALGPDVLLWPEAFWAAQRFHAARAEMGFWGVPGCLARVARMNPLLMAVGALLWLLWQTGKPSLKSPGEGAPVIGLWLWCAGALGVAHLAAPVPYDDYQVPTVFLLSMALAAGFNALPFDSLRVALAKGLALAAVAVTLVGSPMVEGWVSLGQDRFWMRLKEEPDLFRLRRAAALVRTAIARHALPNVLLTQDTYLAVEAGADVSAGYEMGPFMPLPEEAVLPDPLPAVAAWSGYTFALEFPALTPKAEPTRAALLAQWRRAFPETLAVVPAFGQQHTELTVALRPGAVKAAPREERPRRIPCPFHLCGGDPAPEAAP